MIKDLAIEPKLKGIDEKDLNTIINQLRKKNNYKMFESLIIKIKHLIEKTRLYYNSFTQSISNKRINEYLSKKFDNGENQITKYNKSNKK